jgi:uncharacterized protein YbjT (DUF2867 family)
MLTFAVSAVAYFVARYLIRPYLDASGSPPKAAIATARVYAIDQACELPPLTIFLSAMKTARIGPKILLR